MKTIKYLFTLVSTTLIFIPVTTFADVYNFQFNETITPSSVVADGNSKINLNIQPCDQNPDTGEWFASIYLDWTLEGNGVNISNRKTTGFPTEGLEYTACKAASVSWDITSTTPGTKTVVAKGITRGTVFGSKSFNVTFTAPLTSTTTNTKPTSTATTTQNQQQTQAQGTPPAVPALEKLQIGENEVTGEKIREENQFRLTERKVFSGKTIPNGIVKLFFQSDPFEDTVTADANGNWSYELTKDLGEGEHSLQIAVTDPNTNLTSEKSAPTKFVLVAGEKTEVAETVKENNYLWYYLGGGLLLLVGMGVIVFLYLKKKSKKEIKEEV